MYKTIKYVTGYVGDWIRDRDRIVVPFYDTLHGDEI